MDQDRTDWPSVLVHGPTELLSPLLSSFAEMTNLSISRGDGSMCFVASGSGSLGHKISQSVSVDGRPCYSK